MKICDECKKEILDGQAWVKLKPENPKSKEEDWYVHKKCFEKAYGKGYGPN